MTHDPRTCPVCAPWWSEAAERGKRRAEAARKQGEADQAKEKP